MVRDDHEVLADPLLGRRGGWLDHHAFCHRRLVDWAGERNHDRLAGPHILLVIDRADVRLSDFRRPGLAVEIDLDAQHHQEARRDRGHRRRHRLGGQPEREPGPGGAGGERPSRLCHQLGPQVVMEVRVQRWRGRP